MLRRMAGSSWPPRLHVPRPYELSWLALELGIDPSDTQRLAWRLGVDRRTIARYRTWGLTARQADAWSTRAGLHPMCVWAHWR
jgi:hypothetical protein